VPVEHPKPQDQCLNKSVQNWYDAAKVQKDLSGKSPTAIWGSTSRPHHPFLKPSTGYQFRRGSSSRRRYWCGSASTTQLLATWLTSVCQLRPPKVVSTCDQRHPVRNWFHIPGQRSASVALLSMDQRRGTSYPLHSAHPI